MPDWRLGTMGFGYADWAEVFYPRGMKSSDHLAWYARHFNAVELDTTFHATPDRQRVRNWSAAVPDDFRFCAKAPRTITHDGPLDRAGGEMLAFVEVMREFGDKLAAILLQFPPSFAATGLATLKRFLPILPRDVRFAIEFRNSTWFDRAADETAELMRAHNIAWTAGEYAAPPRPVTATADFLYVRWVGEHRRFEQLDHEQIDVTDRVLWWKDELSKKGGGLDAIYGFVNNDYSGYAVTTCDLFRKLLGLPVPPITDERQGKLF
jgi:uncharacterized protein YecE (DUF72 family)